MMTDDPTPDDTPARAPRDSVMLSALIERFGGGAPTKHRIRDLSASGVRIDQVENLRVGATVLVTVGALQSVGATVVWIADGSAGLKFVENINPEDARAKAAIAPRAIKGQVRNLPSTSPTAGWVRDVENPYRK